jgi:hypothetical protein
MFTSDLDVTHPFLEDYRTRIELLRGLWKRNINMTEDALKVSILIFLHIQYYFMLRSQGKTGETWRWREWISPWEEVQI